MNNHNDGGPAFPCDYNMSTFQHDHNGMTLRDYFAGQAMQGLLASDFDFEKFAHIAEDAYAIADAMLLARDQEAKP